MRALATLGVIAFALAAVGAAPPRTTLRGFTLQSSLRERNTESQFLDIPSAQNALDIATAIGSRPHYAGTPADYALAVYMRDAFRAAGLAAKLEQFTARVDTPSKLVVELAPPEEDRPAGRSVRRRRNVEFPIGLDLAEAPESSDPATAQRSVGLPFNSGSGDGDVRAPLVYAARGRDADYATLAAAQVDVRGAIVLIRYGAQFRGRLAERAQTRGAAGVIFYSDPADDGSARGLVYPNGPWRPPNAIQRGSVGSTIHIPTLPVSAANALVLLDSLRGSAGGPGWAGGLAAAYPLARGPGRVHLIVKLNRKPATLWNTIAFIPGVHGDQSVVLGAHRDASVYGVGDDGAGVTTALEVARGLGVLLKGGWEPQRSIVIAGWDGAEAGQLGSRAYVQAHRAELDRGCVAYLNAEQNVTGQRFGATADAAIAPVIVEAAHSVPDAAAPAAAVYDRWAAQTPRSAPRVEAPGGGSDRAAFLYDAGIPVADMNFSGPFGVYESSYDTLRYATLWSDPNFVLHRTAAQLYGLVALRLADADVVPYTFGGYITLLRAGARKIAARAAAARDAADLGPLTHAVDRLAYAARRSDLLVAQANVDSAGELRAARILNSLIYGLDGNDSLAFPSIDAAFATHAPGALNAALGQTAAGLGLAGDALSGAPRPAWLPRATNPAQRESKR